MLPLQAVLNGNFTPDTGPSRGRGKGDLAPQLALRDGTIRATMRCCVVKVLEYWEATNMGCAMPADIFDFWSQVGTNDHVHPADKKVFHRLGLDGHGFNHKTLPGCFMGPLRTAPVVFLFMSPGLSEEDETSAKLKSWRDWHVRQRQGDEPLPNIETPAGKWWVKRVKFTGVDQALIPAQVAFLNIGAYKSKEMKDPELLAALPSSRVCLDWAQQVLFPAAERGERVVVCLRAAKFWGLKRGKVYGRALFSPNVNRAGDMLKKTPRDRVIRGQAIKAILAALDLG